MQSCGTYGATGQNRHCCPTIRQTGNDGVGTSALYISGEGNTDFDSQYTQMVR